MGTVEGKHARRELGIRDAAFDAGEALAEVDLVVGLGVEPFDFEQVLPVFEGDFERIASRSTITSIVCRWFLLSPGSVPSS